MLVLSCVRERAVLDRLRTYQGADQTEIFGPAPVKSTFRILIDRLKALLGL